MLANERVYGSTEERDLDAAIRTFKERMLKNDDYNGENYYNFYKHLNGGWASCLQRNAARGEKKFLFDLDTEELKAKFDYFVEFWRAMKNANNEALIKANAGPAEVYQYRSKSGWHALTSPFNVKPLLDEDMQKACHRNSMMLWSYT